jgi:hypothetical protein
MNPELTLESLSLLKDINTINIGAALSLFIKAVSQRTVECHKRLGMTAAP